MAGRRQTAKMELAIGATIVAALIILLVMLFVWGGSSSLFSNHYWVVVEMSNVSGLREGAPVKIGGFQIGKVNRIQLRPGATELDIVLGIDENRLIPRESTGKISTAGLVGDAFMEIIPGKSTAMIARAPTIAEAERLSSSPVPDFSELLIRVEAVGTQINSLAEHINDILGDGEFRQNVKTITANLVTVSYEATTLLQRGQRVVDNVERATNNVAILSDALKARIEQVADDIAGLTNEAKSKVETVGDNLVAITESAKGKVDAVGDNLVHLTDDLKIRMDGFAGRIDDLAQKTTGMMDNIDATITDVRRGVNQTLNNPELAGDVKASLENIRTLTQTLAGKRNEIDAILARLGSVSSDFADTATHAKGIALAIDPAKVGESMENLSGAIQSVTAMVDKVLNDPVLALSVNKAADRVVKMKFDEMAKSGQAGNSSATLREIQRWTREALDRGHYIDPGYSRDKRPYAFE